MKKISKLLVGTNNKGKLKETQEIKGNQEKIKGKSKEIKRRLKDTEGNQTKIIGEKLKQECSTF